MKLLEGKPIADEIVSRVRDAVSECERQPGLAAILVGDDPASKMYVSLKKKMAHACGMMFGDYLLSERATQQDILDVIEHLNADDDIDGILVQLPLPEHLDRDSILNAIDVKKDVDGLTKRNQRCIQDGGECFVCPFPKAIMRLIESDVKSLQGKRAVVLANSHGFGEAMQRMLEVRGTHVQCVLRSAWEQNPFILQHADIIVTAMGAPRGITDDMISPGTIIIDGAIEKVGNSVFGDVDQERFQDSDVVITPVPGGVGPVTVACLIENVHVAARRSGKCDAVLERSFK